MTTPPADPLFRIETLWRELIRRCLAGTGQFSDFDIRITTVGDTIYADLRCTRAGRLIRHVGDGAPTAVPLPDCADLLDELRSLAYQPDTGSFLIARIQGTSITEFSARADPLQSTALPEGMSVEAADLRREEARFPRAAPPQWWRAIVTEADRQTRAFVDRPSAEPVGFAMSSAERPPAIMAQYAGVVGSIAAATGAIAPVATVSDDRSRTVYRTPTTGFTIHQISDERVVVSGYSAAASAPRDPGAFAGVPTWVHSEHLDESVQSGRMTFCAHYENGSWWHPPGADVDDMVDVLGPARSSTHAATHIARLLDPAARHGTARQDELFHAAFRSVSVANRSTIKPITTPEYVGLLDHHDRRRYPDEVDAAIDRTSGWDLLSRVGLAADDGPGGITDALIGRLQDALGDNTLRIAVAGAHRSMTWATPPTPEVDRAVVELVAQAREAMFRRGRGSWWFAEITAGTAVFDEVADRPPVLLPPTAYAEDIANGWTEPPDWLTSLWTAQSVTLAERADRNPSDPGASRSPVRGLEPFAVLAGRWAAVAGIVFAAADDDERAAGSLPIRADSDGLWCESVEGYRIRLTPLRDGRAVLSGVHAPTAVTDPVTVVDGTPGWVSPLDLHPAVDHGALTVCWWFDGASWAASPTAEFTDADDLPMPWVRTTGAAVDVILQVAASTGRALDPGAVADFVATSERDPAAGRRQLVSLW